MSDIKTRKKENVTIKTLDRTAVLSRKIKGNIVSAKDKTKESYEKNENSGQEYAENRIENKFKETTYYGIKKANEIGKKNFRRTAENIKKGKQNINREKESIKRLKKTGKEAIKTAKRTIKTTKNTIRTTKKAVKTAEKTTKVTIKTTKQVAKTSVKVAQKTGQMVKTTAKLTIKAIQVAIKITIATIKAVIAATQALVSAIIAGGWVAVIIIIVICLIAMICCSIFGIFFSNEKDFGNKTMSSVIREINVEFSNKIIEIQNTNEHDDYEINSNKAKWKDILSIYAVSISNGAEETNVMTLDDEKIDKLKSIFWEMNAIFSRVEEIEKDIEITDQNGNTKIEKVKRKVLYIDITSKTTEEMIQQYNFNEKQMQQLAELQNDKYNSLWSNVISGSSGGSTDIVEIALLQVGNIGGQPFWSWYGFENRVEWCACFVSWCANECGYIESGIIPKFAGCETEGVTWFKTCEQWQDRGYTPKAGDIIFFDWADSNDGKADHVGIVEKSENGKVYTIEGNSRGDVCKQKEYDVNHSEILGYGTPNY